MGRDVMCDGLGKRMGNPDLTDKLPHHSSLTRIRQRWGMERFLKIFQKTVEACNKAGLISGETIHIDAVIRLWVKQEGEWKHRRLPLRLVL
ncbi:MAG: hypothetical protein GXO70_01135 [Acidobacteria bacterium]|nr:hypothetical protein [Acidobacteriota bacterium]